MTFDKVFMYVHTSRSPQIAHPISLHREVRRDTSLHSIHMYIRTYIRTHAMYVPTVHTYLHTHLRTYVQDKNTLLWPAWKACKWDCHMPYNTVRLPLLLSVMKWTAIVNNIECLRRKIVWLWIKNLTSRGNQGTDVNCHSFSKKNSLSHNQPLYRLVTHTCPCSAHTTQTVAL